MKKLIFSVSVALLLTGCANLGNGQIDLPESNTAKIAVQYGTLKLIEESDTIDGSTVIERVDFYRQLVESESTWEVARLVSEVRGESFYADLQPSDKLLLDAILTSAEQSVDEVDGDNSESGNVRALTILDWIEGAATLYAY